MKSTQKQRPEKDVTTIIAKLSKDGLIRLKWSKITVLE
jgi:hypothetical protein